MEPYNEDTKSQNPERAFFNPFPGLRPFSTDESHLFFGREGQSQEVLKFLAQNKFVALLGTSGSGKSSLMYCGVIPFLQGGFIAKAGANWQIITTRPGQSPIRNLAETLTQHLHQESSDPLLNEYIYSTLSASSVGLVEIIKQVPRKPNENILVLVDQFEELFRFKRIKNSLEAFNEVLAYIKLLLEILHQESVPAYIVVTMRSDFIGECAQFQELTKLINDSHYLIPQMTRDDFKQAIEGPIAVGGGSITPFLVQQLLNDLGDNPDQLPILQHALMRTWDSWVKTGHTDEPIDVKDYENIGRLEKALSEHANEAFNELDQAQKEICQGIFKTLTERGGDNRGVRRPTPVNEIAEITSSTPSEVIEIVNHFRVTGRSFLSPPMTVSLHDESVIDISHESLMRIWDKLIIWVNEEYEAVQTYKRLADSAEKFHLGLTALWRPPDLQLALNWRDKQKPTLTWAKRHNPAFERTMSFLENSHHQYQLEEENKIRQQKKALFRTRMFAVVLGSAAIISIYFMIDSFIQKGQAVKQTEIAQTEKQRAEDQQKIAEEQTKVAEEQSNIAKQKEKEALEQKEKADQEKIKAEQSAREATRQKEIANKKSIEASEQKQKAELSAEDARKAQKAAEEANIQAQKLRMLSISQSMAVKSMQINIDTTLKALVAYQSYLFNQQFEGNAFNPDVYNGLYYAQKYFYTNKLTDYLEHKNPVRSIVVNNSENTLYSAGSDGKIVRWKLDGSNKGEIYYNTQNTNRLCLLSPDITSIFVGTDDGQLISFNLSASTVQPQKITSFQYPVSGIMFLSNNEILACDNKGYLKFIQYPSYSVDSVAEKLEMKELTKMSDAFIAVGSKGSLLKVNNIRTMDYQSFYIQLSGDGKMVNLVELEKGTLPPAKASIIQALTYDNNSNTIATGDVEGNIFLWNAKTLKLINRLTGHAARINSLEFSKNGKFFASASNDGSILVWETSNYNQLPLTLSDNEAWVMDVTFDKDAHYLYASYADGKIRRWSTGVEPVADQVKAKINRNFTREEWNLYVAKDIEYQKTIKELSDIE